MAILREEETEGRDTKDAEGEGEFEEIDGEVVDGDGSEAVVEEIEDEGKSERDKAEEGV